MTPVKRSVVPSRGPTQLVSPELHHHGDGVGDAASYDDLHPPGRDVPVGNDVGHVHVHRHQQQQRRTGVLDDSADAHAPTPWRVGTSSCI